MMFQICFEMIANVKRVEFKQDWQLGGVEWGGDGPMEIYYSILSTGVCLTFTVNNSNLFFK